MTVKVQYRDFEPGEFTAIKDRSYEETIALIGSFPWVDQRDNLRVGLTGPSVTMEAATGEFLKLAMYYSGKFILYYIDGRHHEFIRVLTSVDDAASSIQTFFMESSSPPMDFTPRQTFLQHVMVHFRTGDFTYRMRPARLTGAIALICLYLMISAMLTFTVLAPGKSGLWPFLIPALVFFCFAAVQVILLVNHCRHASGQVLILSLGLREFSYGPAANPERFNKDEIRQIITHGRRARGGYPALTRVEIAFADGRSINISCLFISQEDLVGKFPGIWQTKDEVFLPFM
ncbi:MAG TPA: hypothetical protein VMH27_07400 [Puia sp.]|nr:hypothetical protein [Puia sp.]